MNARVCHLPVVRPGLVCLALGLLFALLPRALAAEEKATDRCQLDILQPEGAYVFLNGRRLCANDGADLTVPVKIAGVPEGAHSIAFARPGFQDIPNKVFAISNASPPIAVKMNPGRSQTLAAGALLPPVHVSQMFPVASQYPKDPRLSSKIPDAIIKAVINQRVRLSEVHPHPMRGHDFIDVPLEGGILIGFRYRSGPWSPTVTVLRSVEPIYLTRRGRISSRNFGLAEGPQSEVIAEPGFAVGGLITKTGAVIDSVQVIFMRIRGNRLDPADSYTSPWIAGDGVTGGTPKRVFTNGVPVIGICGRAPFYLDAIGLVFIQ